MHTSPIVTHPLTVGLLDEDGELTPVPTELGYDAGDPFAVSLDFHTSEPGPVRWLFARDLLSRGLHEPSGDGDVHIWPCLDTAGRAVVMVELCSLVGGALVQIRTADVAAFVSRTHEVIRPGAEPDHLDVDALLAALLAV